MNVFRTGGYYRFILLAISAVSAFATAFNLYFGVKPLELFLNGTVCGFAVLITIYIWSVKVRTENGFLHKKTLFGRRTVEMSLINEISVITLRGRYVFMLYTPDKFIMLSTMLENFPALKDILKSNTAKDAFVNMDNIRDELIAGKNRTMKLMLAALLILSVTIVVYMLKRSGIFTE